MHPCMHLSRLAVHLSVRPSVRLSVRPATRSASQTARSQTTCPSRPRCSCAREARTSQSWRSVDGGGHSRQVESPQGGPRVVRAPKSLSAGSLGGSKARSPRCPRAFLPKEHADHVHAHHNNGNNLRRGRSYAHAHGHDIEITQGEVLAKLRSPEPVWHGHIVLCGMPHAKGSKHTTGERNLMAVFVETLSRLHGITGQDEKLRGIVVVDEHAEDQMAALCLQGGALMQMLLDGHLRAVSSDPRNRDALLQRAEVGTCRALVALPEHVSQAMHRDLSTVELVDGRSKRKMVKQIVDTNTVLTMQVARSCATRVRAMAGRKYHHPDMSCPNMHRTSDDGHSHGDHHFGVQFHCVTLLLQESTSNLFFGHANMRHAGAAVTDPRWMDISPLNMSPLFAAGELLAMTCFDRFTVEALFQPQVVPLTRMMLFGDALGHRLFQIRCPENLVAEPFDAAMRELGMQGRPAARASVCRRVSRASVSPAGGSRSRSASGGTAMTCTSFMECSDKLSICFQLPVCVTAGITHSV